MSILIKGMEMPTNCRECSFGYWPSDGSRPYCILTDEDADEPDYCSKRMAHCPLVPVPPHGRLIDADDAIETAWMILRGLGYLKEENPQLEQTVREVFATAPAIEVE